jgi:alanyl-tRNA synthetase
MLDQVQHLNSTPLLVARVEASDAAHLRDMGDWLRNKLDSAIIVLGAVLDERPHLLSVITSDLVQQGYHAGNLVKVLADIVGGGGGGRANMAQAGGRDASKLDEALSRVPVLVADQHAKVKP